MARPVIPAKTVPAPSHPMLLTGQTRRSCVEDVLKLVAVATVVWAAFRVGASALLDGRLFSDPRMTGVVATLTVAAVVLTATFLIARHRQGPWLATLGLCHERWGSTALYAVVALVGAYAAMIATQIVTWAAFPSASEALGRNQERITETLPKLPPVALCGLSLTVGFYEEIICRGFLLTRLRRASGSGVFAVAVTSLVFGALHLGSQEPIAIVPLCSMGAFWAVLTLWRRSVIPAIVGHALFDLINLLVLYYFLPGWK